MLSIAYASETTASLLDQLRTFAANSYIVTVVTNPPGADAAGTCVQLTSVDHDEHGIVLRGRAWSERTERIYGPLLEFRLDDDATVIVH